MNKWIAISVVVLLVAAGAVLVFTNRQTGTTMTSENESTITETTPSTTGTATQPMEEGTTSATANVVLTPSGFEPKNLTIKAGTKVVWTNKSGKLSTVNSDNHPTHLLNSFLNLGTFKDGESLEVVFDKPGTYGYHDHLDASRVGTVVVE